MSDFSLSFWCAAADLASLPTQSGGGLICAPGPPEQFNDTNMKAFVSDFSYHTNVGVTDTLLYPYATSDLPSPRSVYNQAGEFATFSLFNSGCPFGVSHTQQTYDATFINMTVTAGPVFPIKPITTYFFNNPSVARDVTNANLGTGVYSANSSSFINSSSLSTLFVTGQTRIDDTDPISLSSNPWTALSGSFPATTWVHVMISYKSSTKNFIMYMNDSSIVNETVTQADDVTISSGVSTITLPDPWALPFDRADYTDADSLQQVWAICGRAGFPPGFSTLPDMSGDPGATGLIVNMVELWFAKDVFLDWSVAGNRNKFHVKDGGSTIWAPCSVGANGSLPTGSAPSIYCSGGTSSFFINRATGLGMSVYGALLPSSVPAPT